MKRLAKISFAVSTLFSTFGSLASKVYADGLCEGTGLIRNICTAGQNVSITGTVVNVINILLFVAFVLALVFLIIAGIRWIMSGGDKAQTEAARNGVTSALIGLAVVVAAFLLVNIVLKLLGAEGLNQVKDSDIQLLKK